MYFQYDKLSWLSTKKQMFRDNNVDEINQKFYSIYGSIEGQLASTESSSQPCLSLTAEAFWLLHECLS